MIFSKRCKLGKRLDEWCEEHNVCKEGLGYISALRALGYSVEKHGDNMPDTSVKPPEFLAMTDNVYDKPAPAPPLPPIPPPCTAIGHDSYNRNELIRAEYQSRCDERDRINKENGY